MNIPAGGSYTLRYFAMDAVAQRVVDAAQRDRDKLRVGILSDQTFFGGQSYRAPSYEQSNAAWFCGGKNGVQRCAGPDRVRRRSRRGVRSSQLGSGVRSRELPRQAAADIFAGASQGLAVHREADQAVTAIADAEITVAGIAIVGLASHWRLGALSSGPCVDDVVELLGVNVPCISSSTATTTRAIGTRSTPVGVTWRSSG
jgi:hypothetical protein